MGLPLYIDGNCGKYFSERLLSAFPHETIAEGLI